MGENHTKLFPLISEAEIQKRVKELASQISSDYANLQPLLVGILKGAWIFMADLARYLTIPVSFDFLTVSSYGTSTKTSGIVKIVTDLKTPIIEKDVLLVEDILDTGLTLKYILDNLQLRQPRSLKTCVLLDKPERHQIDIKIDYLGFVVPNKFVVGYGIDYNEQYRNLPYIAYIDKE
jgi:hypoxanthine phosphoribosyltransferase|uniref:Hypoxanthine phosphoribosyltransferase n=1 Tax=candidate division WOR-3 bacterium TaxID=2052148 RepID=A0A7C6EAW4_UNCW3